MSPSDWKARDKDRDAAIEVVEAAWAGGQIVEADRDHRVESLLKAETLAEVQMLVHDLQPAEAPAVIAPPADPYGAPPDYPTLAQINAMAPKVARRATLIGVIVVLVAVGGVGAGLVAAISGISGSVDFDTGTSTELPLPGAEPERGVNVLSEGGYGDLVEAVVAANGSSDAFEAVLYPAYAVMSLPVDASSQREDRWYWDGDLESQDSKGTSSYERFDLASVDPAVMVQLVKRVRKLVDEPTSWYAILRGPDPDDHTIMWVYASNEYSESAYLSATADGTVVYNSTRP